MNLSLKNQQKGQKHFRPINLKGQIGLSLRLSGTVILREKVLNEGTEDGSQNESFFRLLQKGQILRTINLKGQICQGKKGYKFRARIKALHLIKLLQTGQMPREIYLKALKGCVIQLMFKFRPFFVGRGAFLRILLTQKTYRAGRPICRKVLLCFSMRVARACLDSSSKSAGGTSQSIIFKTL